MGTSAIKLIVKKNGALLEETVMSQDAIKIGRMSSCHLRIDDNSISMMHAVIEINDGQVHIVDLGSAVGTKIGDERISRASLNDGDKIILGDVEIQVSFVQPQAQIQMPAPALAHSPAHLPATPAAPVAPMPPTPVYPIITRDVDLVAIEDSAVMATEVVVMWNGSVLQVSHYKSDAKKTSNFYLGEDPTCDFPIPALDMKGETKVPLVTNHETGGSTITFLPQMSGDITYDDGRRASLATLAAEGQATPSAQFEGGYEFVLPPRVRVKIDFGSWAFLVNTVPSPKRFVAPIQFNWASQMYTGFSMAMHAVFLFLIYFIPPNPEGMSLDLMDEKSWLTEIMITPPQVNQQEVPEWLKPQKENEPQGGTGKRHKDIEGKMGDRRASDKNARYAIKGPADTKNPHMAREDLKAIARESGILAYLSSAAAPTSPFGEAIALGNDPENALGHLMGPQIGTAFGIGGLGMAGTGRGGGGTGEGTIGLGSLGTMGHGGGLGSGSGYGSGKGYGAGRGKLIGRRSNGPTAKSGPVKVKGSLSREVIRRIVHRHINEVKFCYERELSNHPDLSGRVEVKFIIDGMGGVTNAVVTGSSLGNPTAETCIANSVRRWSFPAPDGGGIVVVTYPFKLTSSQN